MSLIEQLLTTWSVPQEIVELARQPVPHWIGGAPVFEGRPIAVFEPSTATQLTHTFEADAGLVEQVVLAARHAFEDPAWRDIRPLDRQDLLVALANEMAADAEVLAYLECLDVGKPLSQARSIDIAGSVDVLKYFAGMAGRMDGRAGGLAAYSGQEQFGMTLKQPVGVVAAIVPWNFPLQITIWKIAAALAAGCTVVIKPSEVTPMSTARLAELAHRVGFPAGVINVVNGTGATTGAALVRHPDVNKVSFTGSTEVGRGIAADAGAGLKRATLELGGKSAALVCADADIETAVDGVINGIFFNAGQVCDAGSRVIVDKKVYREFTELLIDRTCSLKIGPGLDPDVFMGPLVSEAQRRRVAGYVQKARDSNARFLVDRAQTAPGPGWYLGPVVLGDLSRNHPVWTEEIFGPVLAVSSCNGMQEMLEQTLDTNFGLAAAIYSRDVNRVLTLAHRIPAGTIYVNGHGFLDPAFPFGGLRDSGLGKELGPEQLDAFLETKSVLFTEARAW